MLKSEQPPPFHCHTRTRPASRTIEDPISTPHNNGKEFLVRNKQGLLWCWPHTSEPPVVEDGTIAQSTCGIKWNLEIRKKAHSDIKKKLGLSHLYKILRHQVKSRRNSCFKRIGWSSRWKVLSKLLMRWGDVLTWGGGGGNLHALVEVTNKGLSRVMYRSLFSVGSRTCSMTEPSE